MLFIIQNLMLFGGMAAIIFWGVRRSNRKVAETKAATVVYNRVDTLLVRLAPREIRAIAREETDSKHWTRDYFDDFVGYVYTDTFTIDTAIGFGIQMDQQEDGWTEVTIGPYTREESAAAEVIRADSDYGITEMMLDSSAIRRARVNTSPVRTRILNRLRAYSQGEIDSEIFD